MIPLQLLLLLLMISLLFCIINLSLFSVVNFFPLLVFVVVIMFFF